MGEEVIDSKDQESILRKYLSFYIDKKSYDELIKEIKEKGYNVELFKKIYKEAYLNKFGKAFEEQNAKEDNKDNLKKEDILKSANPKVNFATQNKEVSNNYSSNKYPELKTKTIKGEEFVMVPVKKEDLEKALNKKAGSFFVPTQIMTYVFCILLILAAGYSLYKSFSFSSVLSPEGEEIGKGSLFKVGYPLTFISVSALEEKPFRFNFWYFFVDFFLYIIISYIADLSIRGLILGIKTALKEDEDKEDKEDKESEIYRTPSSLLA
ncbi:MAG: hypothetical protein QXX68_02325 [Candidatus Pacearchaeota archaeon]